MVHLDILFVLAWALLVPITSSKKTYGDMFPHKHKFPFPFPIPGWHPDTNPWNENLYPPFKQELTHRHDKPPRVRLTSDSPAMNGSCISFTAALEFPPCQKLDANGNLLYDEHCDDGMVEASANGQVRSEYVLNWTSWLDDYGFGKCTNLKTCNVFPDEKPFPQTSDWKRRGYVYVWHTMGQYFETCDGSSSHLTLNTTNMTFGAGVMEVMVYRKRERRKYSPISADSTVFFITDKIPLSVNISQKEAANITDKNVFVRGSDVIFKVHIHDPSNYLKTADAVDFIWDFRDGNHLVTHSNVATHAYNMLGKVSVKLLVEAAFRIPCPPPTPTPKYFTQVHTTAIPTIPPVTQVITSKMESTKAKIVTNPSLTTTPRDPTSAVPTTEPFQTDAEVTSSITVTPIPETSSAFDQPTSPPMIKHRHFKESDCFRYMYGSFKDEIIIVEPPPTLYNPPPNQILKVSAAKVTNTSVNFVVTCLGSVPSMACTIVSDSTCREIQNIICEDVAPIGKGCKIGLKRRFQTPGTYCINITLGVPGGLALATTTSVTIGNSANKNTPKSSHITKVVLSSSAVLISIFAFIACMVYKRHKVYRPVRRFMLDVERNPGVGSLSKLRAALFPANEERSRLLTERPL
ncbi:protein QNR-71-like isoform X1 [Myxocyprinus asiaticus]|uniref:protein QNR-71-like isoform X1 n=1 Tax=Myxocyprinus asiaticus TaxID=70543 RepID=UPI002221A4E4|nr:protein QNR-71-like isoform X1 [Myxocyprinus asiaticus]